MATKLIYRIVHKDTWLGPWYTQDSDYYCYSPDRENFFKSKMTEDHHFACSRKEIQGWVDIDLPSSVDNYIVRCFRVPNKYVIKNPRKNQLKTNLREVVFLPNFAIPLYEMCLRQFLSRSKKWVKEADTDRLTV